MKTIKIKRIGDICTKVCSGGTPSTSNASFYDGDIPWLNTNEVNFTNIYETSRTISQEGLLHSAAKFVPVNTVIVAMYGVTAGKSAIAKIPLTTNQACCNLVIDESKADYGYVFYYLKLQSHELNKLANGGAQQNLNSLLIKKYKIPLPSLDTQKGIASILSAYDRLIEVNNKRIKVLEQMAENLYKEWFVRFRFPGHESAVFEDGIPKGWEITRLGSIANVTTGKSNRQDADENGQYPFFDRSQEVKRSNIWLKDCEGIIVPGEGTSFFPRYYQGKFDLHQRCYCVEPKYKGIGKYLYYVLYLNRLYFLSVATGATVPSLRLNNFLSMKFVLPSIDLCKRFNEMASQIFNLIDYYKPENERLTKQRDLLLPRLMSGKLEV